MSLFRAALACVSLLVLSGALPSEARAADAWGCSYEKCVAYCTKVGGKTCSVYCEHRLQDKRRDKICK